MQMLPNMRLGMRRLCIKKGTLYSSTHNTNYRFKNKKGSTFSFQNIIKFVFFLTQNVSHQIQFNG